MTAGPETILIATNNKGKVRELSRILAPLGMRLMTPSDLGLTESPEEDGETFAANALIKARYFCARTNLPAAADDSGLAVDALGGDPGVRSARFAGPKATDAENNTKLLDMMKNVPAEQRAAHFVCAAVFVRPDGSALSAEGRTDGLLLTEPRGKSGFGYDPLFLEPVSGKTFAELDGDEKDAVSHRGKAFRVLAAAIREERARLGKRDD